MPLIRRPRNADPIAVETGANLMKALQDAGIPVASSCGGEAVCGKCLLKIVEGGENLTPPTSDEVHLVERMGLDPELRVSCQSRVMGDVTVDAKYW